MDAKLSGFLQEVEAISPTYAKVIHEVRQTYRSIYPNIAEKFIYGGVGFFINGVHVGGVYPYQKHVSIVFGRGNELQDPDSQLEGGGQFRRHLKISEVSDLSAKNATNFIREAIELELKG